MQTIALIGPAGAGKSTVGELVARILRRTFIDVDDVGHRYYEAAGQPVSRLLERVAADGFVDAHRWWQPARLAALGALADSPMAVIALGAGHSHFEDDERFQAARRAFSAAFVILLLPSRDPAESERVLRERCQRDKGTDWVRDGHDFIAAWVGSAQHLELADLVVYGDGRTVSEIAHQIARDVTSSSP